MLAPFGWIFITQMCTGTAHIAGYTTHDNTGQQVSSDGQQPLTAILH